MEILIRNMLADDVKAVYELGCSCFKLNETPYQYWTIGEIHQHLQSDPDHCFVALDQDKIVGFSLGSGEFGHDKDTGFIEWTAVHADYHSTGLGSKLFTTNLISLISKRKRQVLTDILASNDKAQKMVEKLGFKIQTTLDWWVKPIDHDES